MTAYNTAYLLILWERKDFTNSLERGAEATSKEASEEHTQEGSELVFPLILKRVLLQWMLKEDCQ